MWSGYSTEGKLPVIINVEYDEENEEYIVEVTRGYDSEVITFEPKHEPKDGLMHISDVETSVKLASKLLKDLKRKAQRRKKK
jgi:hypothetical protein